MGLGYCQTRAMPREKPSPRELLSANLRTLMASRPDLSTIKKVAAASRSKLSNGKVGRIYAASHTTDIDTLQHLADVFGMEPWQLMVEGLNPEALPRLADASVLAQILDAVRDSSQPNTSNLVGETPAHRVQKRAGRERDPAFEKALRNAGGSDSGGKSVGVQKPRGRGRV